MSTLGTNSDVGKVTIADFRINRDKSILNASNIEFYKFDLYLKDELIHTTNEVYSSDLR